MLFSFLTCWCPFFVGHLSNALCILTYESQCVNMLVMFLFTWLGYINRYDDHFDIMQLSSSVASTRSSMQPSIPDFDAPSRPSFAKSRNKR